MGKVWHCCGLGLLLLLAGASLPAGRADTPAATGTPAEAAPQKAPPKETRKQFLIRLRRLRAQDATQVVAAAREFLQKEGLSPADKMVVYNAMANIQSTNLKDKAAALATIEEALQKLPASGGRLPLIESKASLLLALGRAEEAETLLQEQWPQVVKAGQTAKLLPVYVAVLQRRDKATAALQLSQQVITDQLQAAGSDEDLFELMVSQLLAAGREGEALGWAKLNFMLCPYQEKSLQGALELLVRVWTAQKLSPAPAAELAKALQSADTPSPLREVKMPALDTTVLRRQLEATGKPAQRITLLLALGEDRQAMLAARRLMLDKPTSNEGVLQVCRVFKAHDLKLQRANAFLEYYKSGAGANPVAAFLQETEPK